VLGEHEIGLLELRSSKMITASAFASDFDRGCCCGT